MPRPLLLLVLTSEAGPFPRTRLRELSSTPKFGSGPGPWGGEAKILGLKKPWASLCGTRIEACHPLQQRAVIA